MTVTASWINFAHNYFSCSDLGLGHCAGSLNIQILDGRQTRLLVTLAVSWNSVTVRELNRKQTLFLHHFIVL